MAPPRNPSRVREAKPYGLALDCSLAVAKTSLCQLGEWIQSLSAKGDIFTRLARGTFLFGYDTRREFIAFPPRFTYSDVVLHHNLENVDHLDHGDNHAMHAIFS